MIEIPPLECDLEPRGYGFFIYKCMIKHKDKIAQIEAATGRADTYDDLLQRCIRTDIFLCKLKIQPGDFISVCTFNQLDAGVPTIAALFINAVMGAVDPTLSLEELVHLLGQTRPKVIFTIPESLATIETAIDRTGTNTTIIVFGDSAQHVSFSKVLSSCTTEEVNNFSPISVKGLDDLAIVFFSSGTSGPPKPICHNHYSLLYQTFKNAQSGFNFDLTFGWYSPYWTVYMQCLGTSIATGTARLIVPKFDRNNPWLPFYSKPNYVILNVFQSLTLCCFPKPEEVDISSVDVIMVTGGSIQPEQIDNLQKIFVNSKIYLLYGQSEVLGYLNHFTPKDEKLRQVKRGSVGFGQPGISYKIAHLETRQALGPNQKGELCVKTKCAMIGYYKMNSEDAWESDGWLKTGDIAYYDEDGCFYIEERIKEMFKYQGWHVTPHSIEIVLLQHPAVASAVVVGVPHEYDGHRPIGVVVLKTGSTDVTAEEIQKFVDDQVEDKLKLRGGLEIVESLPMTASGKINRKKVKDNLGL